MITLYGFNGSRSIRVLWALEELEQSYEYVEVDLLGQRVGDRPLADLNPGCKVPVLQDGDFMLTESAAICLYLAELDPVRRLLPEDTPRARARLAQWCSFAVSELEQPLWTKAKHRFVLPEELRVPDVGKAARYEFERALEVLEKGLDSNTWMLGEQFTVADILIGNTLAWAASARFPLQSEILEDYLARIEQRPALARARAREASAAA